MRSALADRWLLSGEAGGKGVSILSLCALVYWFGMVDSLASSPLLPDRFVGFDLGTSGARVSVIEKSSSSYKEVHSDAILWNSNNCYDDPEAWTNAIHTLLSRAVDTSSTLLPSAKSICVSGTSASCLLVDSHTGEATRHPRMYNFDVTTDSYGKDAMAILSKYAPPRHTANTNTGSFAKLMRWNAEKPIQPNESLCHQADFVVMNLLHGEQTEPNHDKQREVPSDWHNCLKLGYDVQNLCWPDWMLDCLSNEIQSLQTSSASSVLPDKIVSPGQPIGALHSSWIEKYNFPKDAVMVGGTTDSNAAFFAAVGGSSPEFGTAVTSLGSTLAIKMLSKSFVEDASCGVYSHRFPVFGGSQKDHSESHDKGQTNNEAWLVGGASNVGCAVLRQEEFSNSELVELSQEIDPTQDSPFSYYPLIKKGERFPVADSEREPLLEPKPDNRKDYLHGILQGISDVECQGFHALGSLGATPSEPFIVWSCGGGAKNDMWLKMRERKIAKTFGHEVGAKVLRAENTEASFGAAILAAATFD